MRKASAGGSQPRRQEGALHVSALQQERRGVPDCNVICGTGCSPVIFAFEQGTGNQLERNAGEVMEFIWKIDFLTLIVIIYILLVAVKGAIKGFYGAMITTLFMIGLFVMTLMFSPKTYNVIRNSQTVNSYLEETAWNIVGTETEKIAAGMDNSLLKYIPISDELGEALQNRDAGAIRSESIQNYLKNAVKTLLLYAAAVILTIIFSVVILVILAIILHKFVEFPGVRQVDRVMGFVLGLLEGLIGVWVLLAILHLFEFTETGGNLLRAVQASPMLSMLEEYNLVYLAERYVMGAHL